ncbi:MAG TPA: ATP-binding protein [Acidimicrobiales bacterium]|nr:ATP-binding protein [Acidimicrobiales bacterium]
MTVADQAQFQFAAEFALFLVCVAGLALVVLRSALLTTTRSSRVLLGAGFVALGMAAFLHGSLLAGASAPIALALRAAGLSLLSVGSLSWAAGDGSRRVLWAGVAVGVVTFGLSIAGAGTAAAVTRIVEAGLFGAALVQASRRSVAARFAASAAATLLMVVLVLSVGLSAVLANSVADQAISDLDGRAVREANAIEDPLPRDLIQDSGLVARTFTGLRESSDPASPLVLPALDETGAVTDAQRTAITSLLAGFSNEVFTDVGLAYVSQSGAVVASARLGADVLPAVASSRAVVDTLAGTNGRATVEVATGRPLVLGVSRLAVKRSDGSSRPAGAVVAAVVLDRGYLASRASDDRSLSLALVGRSGTLSSAGSGASRSTVSRLASRVLAGTPGVSATAGGRFVVARPVRASTTPLFALVASRPTTAVDDVRESLYRTFFVIAFGGSILALLLAAIVGDRIGAGLRRLTRSAQAIAEGDLHARAGIHSDDEVGVLGAAFDSMAVSIEDKTEALRQAAADEARLRNRLEAVVAGMGEALIAVDENGVITDFNEAAERLLGVAAADARGRPVGAVVRLHSEEGIDLGARLVGSAETRWSELGVAAGPDGGDVPVAVTSGPLGGSDGEAVGAVLVLRDLRGEREVERMKREFLSRIGHELRTPLTPLLGYAQLLASRDVPPERARDLHRAMAAGAKRLERIVEMLEFFASIQAGRDVLRPEHLDVRPLLADVVTRRAASVNGSATELARPRVARDTPEVVGDRYWLARAVDELLDNSIKFSPDGGRVAVSARRVELAGQVYAEIAVRDAGVGMTQETVDHAFAEWAQGDESDTRAYGGLGLGLPLVQRVVERHGGLVRCDTAPGKGTRLALLLPAAGDDRESGDAQGASPAAAV